MTRNRLIYAAVVVVFGLTITAVFLYLNGFTTESVGAGVVATAIAAASSRGQALQTVQSAEGAIAAAQSAAGEEEDVTELAGDVLMFTRNAMADAAAEVADMTPDEKLTQANALAEEEEHG